jgi:hypothetical protein
MRPLACECHRVPLSCGDMPLWIGLYGLVMLLSLTAR